MKNGPEIIDFRPVRLEFVVRPRWKLDQARAVGYQTHIVQLGTSAMCPPAKVSGVWPSNDAWLRAAFNRSGVGELPSRSRHSRTAHGREILAASFRSGAPRWV